MIAVSPAPTDSFDSSVAVVVRNNTSGTLYNVSASGIARRNGALVGSGDSQGFAPAVVHSGEWAYGYVYFGTGSIAGATFQVTATADSQPSDFGQNVDLKIAEVNKTSGQFGETVIGIVSNPTQTTITPPVEVDLVCFDGSSPKSARKDFTDGNGNLMPGGTASFSISLASGECASSYAVSAQGSGS